MFEGHIDRVRSAVGYRDRQIGCWREGITGGSCVHTSHLSDTTQQMARSITLLQVNRQSAIAYCDVITACSVVQYRGYLENQVSHYAPVFSIAIYFLLSLFPPQCVI
uniref:Uncharacterized protein n=1 Tax=Timema genevievae TaxID=629358 RepID=A0A7R9PPG3_TIMGE|nr:unnamed protein product [Timema genevievae]